MIGYIYTAIAFVLLYAANGENFGEDDYTSLKAQINANQALWIMKGSSNYDFEFEWKCFCTECDVAAKNVKVVNNKLQTVTMKSSTLPCEKPKLSKYKTIDGLFDMLLSAIEENAESISVTFDKEYGYPKSAYIDYDELMIDEERGWVISSVDLGDETSEPGETDDCDECIDGIPECETENCSGENENPLCMESGPNGCDKCDCDSFMKSKNHPCVDCEKAITGCVSCLDLQGCIQCDYKNNWEWFWDGNCKIGRCKQHVE